MTGLSEPAHPFPRPDVTERLTRALTKINPNLVIACYGMNDGIYHPFSERRFIQYQKGIHSMIDKVNASGAQLIFLTPPPFDPQAPGIKNKLVEENSPVFSWTKIYQNYDSEVISRYAIFILSLRSRVAQIVDIHTPINNHMAEKRTIDPDYHLSNDGVHINRDGHRLMAQTIYQALLRQPLPKLPNNLIKKFQSKQNILAPAWLTHIGHTRPGVKAGLPLDEAKAKAAAIN